MHKHARENRSEQFHWWLLVAGERERRIKGITGALKKFKMRWQDLFTLNVALIAGIVLAFLLLAFKLYKDFVRAKQARLEQDDASNRIPNEDAEVTLILFFADWCPACQKIKPEWNAFAGKFRNESQRIRGYNITCQNMNCSDYQTNATVQTQLDKYGVSAFPAVVLVGAGDNGYEKYKGTITQRALEAFVGHVVSSKTSK